MSLQWFLFIAAIVLLLQGWVYRRFGFHKLSYSRTFSKHAVFEGEEAEMVERIVNRKILPLPWLRIESKMHPLLRFYQQSDMLIKHDEFHRSMFSLMPYTGITRRHRIQCLRRGCFRLTSAAMTLGDAFGIQEVGKDFMVDAELLVYPKPLAQGAYPIPSHSWQGNVAVRRWILEDPFLTAGVREYRFGDPINRINWKASARSGDLMVYHRDHTADPHLMILLNIDLSESMWDAVTDAEAVERGISLSAALVQQAIQEGIPTGFGTNAYQIDDTSTPLRIAPQASRAHLEYIYEMLAKLIIARSMTFYTFLQEEVDREASNLDILLLTFYQSPRMEGQIQALRARGNAVQVIPLEPARSGEVVS